jgi:hypothetical protein
MFASRRRGTVIAKGLKIVGSVTVARLKLRWRKPLADEMLDKLSFGGGT